MSRTFIDAAAPVGYGLSVPTRRSVLLGFVMIASLGTTAAGASGIVDPQAQAKNLLVSQEREAQFGSPQFTARMIKATQRYQTQRLKVDAGRAPNPNTCSTVALCPIDPRLSIHRWRHNGGLVKPVLYTARTGATLSGHIWATRKGPAKRPGVITINGSVLGIDQFYWYLAQALARSGFVVMTFDAQGEGMSDQFGQAPDQEEGAFAGTPVLGESDELGGSGLPFYDGGEDSLNFFLSTPRHPYVPVPSRTSHTSHAAKQRHRAATGLDAAYNPLWHLVNRNEIGVTGHSYGAEAASWLGQQDPRFKAVVALDSLCQPVAPAPSEVKAVGGNPLNRTGLFGLPTKCFGAPGRHTPQLRRPALGLSADYLLFPQPYTVAPPPLAKSHASLAYSKAGVDSGQIVIRGGTHYEFNDTPTGAVPASWRGIDLVTWYATAWFDKYLKHDHRADKMLRTKRWQHDQIGRIKDPSKDGNLFSYLYRSRLDIHLDDGNRFDCENLRAGCGHQVPARHDCGPSTYSYARVDSAGTRPELPRRRC